jgi:hypothetical protein
VASTIALGCWGVAAVEAYEAGLEGAFWAEVSLAAGACTFGRAWAPARLTTVFSRLTKRTWSAESSSAAGWEGGVPFGRRDCTSRSCMKSWRMWPLAQAFSSDGEDVVGCMAFRYDRVRPSTDASESRLGGRIARSCSPGQGRKLGRDMVCISGMVIVGTDWYHP